MSKFKIKMKIQGLEVEIEGSREEASSITHSLGQQMANLLQPVAGIIDGEVVSDGPSQPLTDKIGVIATPKRQRRKRSTSSIVADSGAVSAIDFTHLPDKFGLPNQSWKTSAKSIWLLFVVSQLSETSEMSARSIAETFNKHFKQSGIIAVNNVTRDLGYLKSREKPSPVSENTTSTPSAWFLTDEGIRRAQTLVTEALGQSQLGV